MDYISIVFQITILVCFVKFSSACNGYVLKLHYIKNCGDDNVIEIKDLTSTLDKDCNIIPKGCISTKGFKSAMMHYRAEKRPLPGIDGDIDLCNALREKNEYALLGTGALGFPQSCPVERKSFCLNGNKKVNISKYKSKLGITLGLSTVNVTLAHDTGITCVTIKVEFSKPRRRG